MSGEGVETIERNRGVAVRARHLLVDLGDHEARRVHRGAGRVDRGAQRAVAVRVGRGELHQRDVERDAPRGEEPGDVGEEDGHEVGAPGGDGLAQRGAGEERDRSESARRARDRRSGTGPAVCR